MIKKIFLITVLTLLLLTGSVNAQGVSLPSPGLLPGNPFYFLDSLFERLGSLVTFGDLSNAKRHFALAEERLAESKALADKGDSSRVEKSIEKYQERLGKSLINAEQAKEGGRNTDEVLAKIAEATIRHQEILAEVYEKVPEQAKGAIERAMKNGAKGYDTALSAVSGEKQDEVRNQVENDTKDVEGRLEQLREDGIPIPNIEGHKTINDIDM